MYYEEERRYALAAFRRALRTRSSLSFAPSTLGKVQQPRQPPRPGSSHRESLLVELIDFERAFARLPEEQQRLLHLRYVEGHTIAATAPLVGRSARSLNRDIPAALDALAAILDADDQPRRQPNDQQRASAPSHLRY